MAAITLHDYQEKGVQDIRTEFRAGNAPVLFVLSTGGGKCLARGTPVLMFDGSIKAVEDIRVGDQLMGPDSKPRNVLSLAAGKEMMYRVTPVKGDPYVVNESHILSLKRTSQSKVPKYPCQRRSGEIVNISVLDYLASSASFKHLHKGWRAAVEFPEKAHHPALPPYMLGVWLGDGTSTLPAVTSVDHEIVSYLTAHAALLDLRLVESIDKTRAPCFRFSTCLSKPVGRGQSHNSMWNELRRLDLISNKHVPHEYLTGSTAQRLEVLAGLMDTDGSYTGKGYDFVSKVERLTDDVVYLARSVGLSAYKVKCQKTCGNNGVEGTYYRACLSGHVDKIPCKIARKKAAPRQQIKDVLVTGIKVEPIGVDDYYGFEIDGDHLFMLGDFTVTHNTYTFSYIAHSAANLGTSVVIIVHRKELLLQASESLTKLGIDHGMISPHFTADPRKRIQVASIDTLLIRMKKRKFEFGLVIFDEAHHVVAANKWGRAWEGLGKPPMLGVTATPVRGDGKGLGDHCGGVFKAMVQGAPLGELIRRGILISPTVYTSLEAPDLTGLKKDKDGDYSLKALAARVDKPIITGSALAQYKKICPGARAIVFCSSIEHAKHVVAEFNAAGYRFALLVGEPEMKDTERTHVNKMLRKGELDGACTVDLVSEGYDLPDLECCIMLRPTASESLFIQQVGRVMRRADGKTRCFLLDHVGNVGSIQDGEFKRKHGMPNEEREWTLDGKDKRKGKKAVEATIDVMQCPKCFLAHMPEPVCPGCGHVYIVKARKLEQVDGDLHQLTPEMIESLKQQQRIERGSAQTMDELKAYAAKMGYSPGWAKHTFEARKRKRATKAVLTPPQMELRPPEPSVEEMKLMTLTELERVVSEQGWPRDFAGDFFNSQGLGGF